MWFTCQAIWVTPYVQCATAFRKECGEARFLYLKGSLLHGLNVEVNQHKESVVSYLQRLGFSPVLIGSLDEVEKLYRSTSPFELKSSLGHLRSFLETLHADTAQRLQLQSAEYRNARSGWGSNTLYLRTQGLLSKQEEDLVTSLYTLISDTGIHPPIAEREYARMLRNVVIEYGLLLLSKLDRSETE
jgi:hypothetical protein